LQSRALRRRCSAGSEDRVSCGGEEVIAYSGPSRVWTLVQCRSRPSQSSPLLYSVLKWPYKQGLPKRPILKRKRNTQDDVIKGRLVKSRAATGGFKRLLHPILSVLCLDVLSATTCPLQDPAASDSSPRTVLVGDE
ncbi:hypothetical protein DNTS_020665, partial [Danionella cerebrum]